MGRTVLVTGVSRYLGGRVAALLATEPGLTGDRRRRGGA